MSLLTGYGKSLCYAVLPKVFDLLRGVANKSIVIVVSPLIALMKDQVATFSAKGIRAAYVSDKEDSTEKTRRDIKKGKYVPAAVFESRGFVCYPRVEEHACK